MDQGQVGYEAYRNHTGGISLASGQPIPEWAQLRPEIKQAWAAAESAHPDAKRIDWMQQQLSEDGMDMVIERGEGSGIVASREPGAVDIACMHSDANYRVVSYEDGEGEDLRSAIDDAMAKESPAPKQEVAHAGTC
jgi:hypothetical protein